MDEKNLLFLLREGHFDMPERIKKCLWPHSPLQISDCVIAIVHALNEYQYFPQKWINKKDGELIDDVAVIEKINDSVFIFRHREASPYNLKKISTFEEKVFKTAESAAEYYLRNILKLPGDLDGWQVVER